MKQDLAGRGPIGRWIRFADRFLRSDEQGGLLASVGLMLPVIIGIGALSVDVGMWFKSRRDYQTGVDAAAVGAAWQRLKGRSTPIADIARADASRNGLVTGGSITMTVNNPPLSGAYAGRGEAVEVIVTAPEATLLAALVFEGAVQHRVRAVAAAEVQGSACIFALDTMAQSAVKVWGSTQVEAIGCVIGSNSNSSKSIDIGGSSSLKAESLWAVGNVSLASGASADLARPATTDAFVLDNPYANLVIPPLGSCSYNGLSVGGIATLNPGVYCNGLNFGSKADVTLTPGTYYINKGNLSVNGQARVRCSCPNATDGVTIILTSSGNSSDIGEITINGGADIVLRAPTAPYDPFKGVLLFQDPAASSSGTNRINGGSTMSLTGALYFPRQQIQYNGDNSSQSNNCTQIIARTVEFTGNSKIYNNGCEAAGIVPVKVKGINLVE